MMLADEIRLFFLFGLLLLLAVILPLGSVLALYLERGAPPERASADGARAKGEAREARRFEREVGMRQARWRLLC
jgi:hypothetical protein